MTIHHAHTTETDLVIATDLAAGSSETPALVVMPSIDMEQARGAAERMLRFAGAPCRIVIVEDRARRGFIACVNAVCAALRPEFAAYVAQDALAGGNWAAYALDALRSKNKAVCALNDGTYVGRLAQFGMVRMAFAESHYGEGTLFYPGYRRHRADEELTHVAHEAGLYTFEARALMMEVDYREARPIDPDDTRLYFERKAARRARAAAPPPHQAVSNAS